MAETDGPSPSDHSERGLDWLNFFIADVQTGFGPFIAVYLISKGWSQGQIGLLLTVGGLTAIASQIPGGALVDAVPSKRWLIGAALATIAATALIFAFTANPPMIYLAEMLHGATAGVITPALASIGLGLVGHRALSRRLGRNQRYDAWGTVLTAGAMGLIGQFVSKGTTFLVAGGLCLPAAYALTRIRPHEINYAAARSARNHQKPREAARPHELCRNRLLLVFIAGLVLFQFGNASLVPLATERLGQQQQQTSEIFTSALVVVPQVLTALIAGWVARRADDWGRKPLLLAGFAALPVRAVLLALAPGAWFVVAIQILDGLSAAVIGIMTPLVIADVARGSGRYNLAQGVAGAAIGIGAALSTVSAGYLAERHGYAAGFLGLAFVGACGLATVGFLLPETMPHEFGGRRRAR